MSQLIEVKVPDIGDFSDVPVIELFVKVGDTIKVDDAIAMLESDKATMDVPSSVAGVVKEVLVNLGDRVSEGSVLIKVEAAGAAAAAPAPAAAAPAPVAAAPAAAPAAPAPAAAPAVAGGVVEVKVPDIGDFDSVPIIELFVKVGDSIKAEDAIATLESDKATMDVPSSATGVVKEVLVQLGSKVSEGSVLIKVETGAGASAPAPAASAPAATGRRGPRVPPERRAIHRRSGSGILVDRLPESVFLDVHPDSKEDLQRLGGWVPQRRGDLDVLIVPRKVDLVGGLALRAVADHVVEDVVDECCERRLHLHGRVERLERVAAALVGVGALSAGDARVRWYMESTTADPAKSWELDAMDPNDLRARVREAIKGYIDADGLLDIGLEERDIDGAVMASHNDMSPLHRRSSVRLRELGADVPIKVIAGPLRLGTTEDLFCLVRREQDATGQHRSRSKRPERGRSCVKILNKNRICIHTEFLS